VVDGMEICWVNSVANRIRKLRQSKDYSQQNMADELAISKSAYSKIETGATDPSVKRIQAIAKILEVEVIYFFQEQTAIRNKLEEPVAPFGYATQTQIEELTQAVSKLKNEMALLKASLPKSVPIAKKKKA
jgi:transcriptional regulator with XRE-family HTH domain